MDEEGFSGRDGRTTIFDYWSTDSLLHGFFARRKMTAEEKAIEAEYKKILSIATTESAVSEGEFFDLMYVNPTTESFDASRQYAFLRKYDNELLIVLANFSEEERNCKINIPQHAFDYLKISKGITQATDLMNGTTSSICLSNESPLKLTVKPWNGKIIKIKGV